MDEQDIAGKIIAKVYQHAAGEITLTEHQTDILSKAMNRCKPELQDVWTIMLKVIPGISQIAEISTVEAAITRNVLQRYASDRLRGIAGQG